MFVNFKLILNSLNTILNNLKNDKFGLGGQIGKFYVHIRNQFYSEICLNTNYERTL